LVHKRKRGFVLIGPFFISSFLSFHSPPPPPPSPPSSLLPPPSCSCSCSCSLPLSGPLLISVCFSPLIRGSDSPVFQADFSFLPSFPLFSPPFINHGPQSNEYEIIPSPFHLTPCFIFDLNLQVDLRGFCGFSPIFLFHFNEKKKKPPQVQNLRDNFSPITMATDMISTPS